MPAVYCGPCGTLHSGGVNEDCAVSMQTRRTGKACEKVGEKVAKMADGERLSKKEEAPKTVASTEEEESDDDSMDERERAVTDRIKALEKKKRLVELERREQELEDDMERLARKRTRGRSRSRRSSPLERRHHHHHRRSSSSSSSSARSTSQEKKKRSKWSIRRYLEDRKDLKKLSPFELVESSCSWVLDKKDVDVHDLKRFIMHLKYVASKAKSGQFTDKAHASYDLAIRKLAVDNGFDAFCAGNPELALQYYAFESMRGYTAKGGSHGAKASTSNTKQLFMKDGKKPCFAYNKEEGCNRDEKTCNFGHWCSKCGGKSHIRANCRKE